MDAQPASQIYASRLHASIAHISSDDEIILVNDASPDNAWPATCLIAERIQESRVLTSQETPASTMPSPQDLSTLMGPGWSRWATIFTFRINPILYHDFTKSDRGLRSGLRAERAVRQEKTLKGLSSKIFYRIFDHLSE